MKLHILIFAITLTACSTLNHEQTMSFTKKQQEIVFPFVSTTGKVWSIIPSMNGYEYSTFTSEQYKELLDHPRPKKLSNVNKLKEMIKEYELLIYPYEKTFVSCLYSNPTHFAICQDARCEHHEKKRVYSRSNIEDLLKNMPYSNCPQ